MKRLDIFLLVYKILILLLVLSVLAWGVYSAVDAVNKVLDARAEGDSSVSFGNALGIVIVLIASIVADAAIMVLALPGLIVSICAKENPKRKKHVIHFALLTMSPALSFGIYYVLTLVCANMINGA